MRTKIMFAAVLLSLSSAALAGEKYLRPDAPGAGLICPQGQALTYTMVCDPGSRSPIEEIFPQRTPGVSICRVQFQGCGPVAGRTSDERPGMTVRDAENGTEMVLVSFGIEHLLGEAPDQRH